jgi:hypothetical protein
MQKKWWATKKTQKIFSVSASNAKNKTKQIERFCDIKQNIPVRILKLIFLLYYISVACKL